AAEVRRAEADHRFAEGDDVVWHGGSRQGRMASSLRTLWTMATYCRARSRIRSKLRSATALGSTSWPPTPRQHAPAFRKAAAVFRSTPPVGISRICGRGPRRALKKG